MQFDDEDVDVRSFNKICPECGVGNPEESEICMVCERDLSKTVLFFEDEFYDIEVTSELFIEYRKNFYRTRRTGKVKKFRLENMENIEFGHPIKRFIFKYEDNKEVYALTDDNYKVLKEFMVKTGRV